MEQITLIEEKAAQEIEAAQRLEQLKKLETQYLGKQGELTLLMKALGQIPKEDRPAFGQAINETKEKLSDLIHKKLLELKKQEQLLQFEKEAIDITMPGYKSTAGRKHVLQMTIDKVKEIMSGLGFEYLESPELEDFENNFTHLNYPPDHPAMDEQDTFYINNQKLLRTQCTALQSHVFQTKKPPLRCFTIGKCFRNEAVDRTHSHTFHQVDAFMIDEGISMANLKGTLSFFVRAMFGEEVTVRFRPDFFPFVEPGVDYAISTPKFAGGKWLELGGAGLIHPNILENFGIPSEKYTGWAFGLGIERIPMLAHGITDLRPFLENDRRFLEQFNS